MNYNINPLAFTGIFAVPNCVVDDNIRLASALQLKTLLYMLRHSTEGSVSLAELSKAIGSKAAVITVTDEGFASALVKRYEEGQVKSDQ